jgi:hypothetical protein
VPSSPRGLAVVLGEAKQWLGSRIEILPAEFHRNFFAHKQLHFILLMLFKATDKSPFTQLFALM